jgi:hypothetical protein
MKVRYENHALHLAVGKVYNIFEINHPTFHLYKDIL